jgi:transcription elongation factor Elf1
VTLTPVSTIQCAHCGRKGQWAVPSISAAVRFCSSWCSEGDERDAQLAAENAAIDAEIAKWDAETAVEEEFRRQEQADAEAEYERGVLSLEALQDGEEMLLWIMGQ